MRTWLSPPDPSTNYNTARGSHQGGTSEWFTHGSTFEEWIANGSLLWIHGKRMSSFRLMSIAVANSDWPSDLAAGSGKTIFW